MAKAEKKKPRLVECCQCRHFKRDTEGPNCSVMTGEYFMGVCLIGCTPDTKVKQFAERPHECKGYSAK